MKKGWKLEDWKNVRKAMRAAIKEFDVKVNNGWTLLYHLHRSMYNADVEPDRIGKYIETYCKITGTANDALAWCYVSVPDPTTWVRMTEDEKNVLHLRNMEEFKKYAEIEVRRLQVKQKTSKSRSKIPY